MTRSPSFNALKEIREPSDLFSISHRHDDGSTSRPTQNTHTHTHPEITSYADIRRLREPSRRKVSNRCVEHHPYHSENAEVIKGYKTKKTEPTLGT